MTVWTHLAYLVASASFIFGLKLLSSPRTARRGNLLGALGMLITIVTTLIAAGVVSPVTIVSGLLVGAVCGAVFAVRVQMTAMPQLVALFNGFGGAASALVAVLEYLRLTGAGQSGLAPAVSFTIPVVLSLLIGSVTFSGSMIAFAKLQELIRSAPVLFPLQHPLNLLLTLLLFGLMGGLIAGMGGSALIWAIVGLSLLLGVLLVIPIGGADMPIVISLLNSYSGLAGSAAGFVIGNNILIIAGALVGASGLILTEVMCRGMNRSLANVAFGGFGATTAGALEVEGTVRSVQPDEAAIVLSYARSVVIVPGYGLAVAQAQHQVREVATLLEKRGVDVRYAIHPVAGRMPGHMNVLLAEADVPYDRMYDLEQINADFERTDVAVIIGANDVVNPSARNDPGSPIYGMPILDADRARHVLVLKRSMSPGFAGIDNPLFYLENTMMLFGDAKDSLLKLIEAIKDVP